MEIISTWKSGGYKTIAETSMTAPHVTGTAALALAEGVTDVRRTLYYPPASYTDLRIPMLQSISSSDFSDLARRWML